MKLKARDIIPDWPKPRSTSTFLPTIDDLTWWKFCHAKTLSGKEVIEFTDEFLAQIRYHEAQQRMIAAYFEQYRQPPPDPLEGMRWAFVRGIQVKGPS